MADGCEVSDVEVLRAIALLQTATQAVLREILAEVKTFSPRLAAQGARVEVLTAEARAQADAVEKMAAVVTPLLEEAGILKQATAVMHRAVALVAGDADLKFTFERILEVIESRITSLRSEVVNVLSKEKGGA